MYKNIEICEYLQNRDDNDILVDLRDEITFQFGTVLNAINIPLNNLSELYKLPKDRQICVFCQYGEFSPQAAELLDMEGYNAVNLTGGYIKYLRGVMENNI